MGKHSWSNREKAEFLLRLGELLNQGYTISGVIELFLKFEKEKVRLMLSKLKSELQNGRTFSEALVLLNIPGNIISFIYFSEHYGQLAKGLMNGGLLLRKTEENKQKLQTILKYPVFLIWMIILFFIILSHYLFPHFIQLFETVDVSLPLITRMFLSFLGGFPYYISALCLFIMTVIVYYYVIFQKKDLDERAKIISCIPFFGHFYKMAITYVFSINLSCLIGNGMSIYDAFALFKDHKKLGYISHISSVMISKLEEGETLQTVLIRNSLYLKELAYVVDHGQSSSRLAEELEHYSTWILRELELKIKNLLMVIQPILFLFIGLLLLFMFSSILLPIFTLINGI